MSKRAIVAVAVVGAVVVAAAGYFWFAVLAPYDATIYAAGFSEQGFALVSRGMSKTDVKRLLGEPLTHVEGMMNSDNKWFYAFLDYANIPEDDRVTNTWFEVREVDFDRRGRVKSVLSSTEQFE